MPAHLRLHGLAHLTHLQGEGGLLEVGQRLTLRQPGQLTAVAGRVLIVRHLPCQLTEVGTGLQGLIHRVDAHLRGIGLFLCGLLTHHQQDVGGLHHATHRVDAVLGLCIDALSLSLQVGILDECGANLLVAISLELLLERRQRVEVCGLRSLHLQLVVHEQIDVLLHIFLVDDAFRIILIVRILKLRAQHRLAVDGHDHGIVLRLGSSCHSHHQANSKKNLSHFPIKEL